MQAIYYTAAGILLYLVSDGVLRVAERVAGRPFEHRSLVFFVIILSLAVSSFGVVRLLTQS